MKVDHSLRVLVTGATGLLGRELVQVLHARGSTVRALVRPSSDLSVLPAGTAIVHGDVTEPRSLERALENIDLLFHAAGLVSTSRRARAQLFAINVDGTRNVLAAARAAAVRRIVYTSSSWAVGYANEGRPITERAEWIDPGIAYAQSKRRAEEVAVEFAHQGLPVVIVCPSFVLGPDARGARSVEIVRRFLADQVHFYVEGGLCPVDVEDVALGHVLAAERGRAGERYLLSGENISFTEFFRLLAEMTHRRRPYRVPAVVALAVAGALECLVAPLSGRQPRYDVDEVRIARLQRHYDATKARVELGFSSRGVRETLERTVQGR
jgi:dihydroflavonol-4-reductase